MKEKLMKIITAAKQEHSRYCIERMRGPLDDETPYVTEAAFIAEALIDAGVCFRLAVSEADMTKKKG